MKKTSLTSKIVNTVLVSIVLLALIGLVLLSMTEGEPAYKGQRELISLIEKNVSKDDDYQYFDVRMISFDKKFKDIANFTFDFETTILGRAESIFNVREKNGSTELEITLYDTGENYANIKMKFRIVKGGGGILILKSITKSKRLENISDKEIEEEIIPKLLDALRNYLQSYSNWLTLEKQEEIQELSDLGRLLTIWGNNCEPYFRHKRRLSELLEQKGDDVFMKQAIDSYLSQAYLPLDFKFGDEDIQILIGMEKFEYEKKFEAKKISISNQEFEIASTGRKKLATVLGMDNTKAIKILEACISQLKERNSKTYDRIKEISKQQNWKAIQKQRQEHKEQEAIKERTLMRNREEIEQLLSL